MFGTPKPCKYCGRQSHVSMQCALKHKPLKSYTTPAKTPCKHCQANTHTSLMCPHKPRAPLKRKTALNWRGPVTAKWLGVRNEWIQQNPPVNGYWDCYLRISPHCQQQVDIYTLTLDHVKSRSRHPELRYELTNLKPCCAPCNAAKGSRDLEEL